MVEEIKAYRCTCGICGQVWVSEGIPERCAGRKKCRRWNSEAGIPAEPRRAAVKKVAGNGVGAKIPEKSDIQITQYADDSQQEYEDLDVVSAGEREKATVAKVVRKKKVEAGEPRQCRHGLTFHRGCNA